MSRLTLKELQNGMQWWNKKSKEDQAKLKPLILAHQEVKILAADTICEYYRDEIQPKEAK